MNPHSLVVLALVTSSGAADTLFVAQDGSEDYTTIGDAIADASSGDTVTVLAGTYAETIDTGGLDLTIQAHFADLGHVIIDGEDTRQCVQCQSGETSDTSFIGLTFSRGYASYGGGADIEDASPSFSLCTFSDCMSTRDGSGLFVEGGAPTFFMCTFDSCSLTGTYSAYGGGARLESSDATFLKCTFSNCTSKYAGAVSIDGGTPSFTECIFSENTATWAYGAVYSTGAAPSFDQCDFTGNLSEGYTGGALGVNWGTGTIEITDCIFTANQAGTDGDQSVGAASLSNSNATLTGCAFDANTADVAGGLAIAGSVEVTMSDCSFSNHVNGALLITQATVAISDCAFTDNSNEGSGGGAIKLNDSSSGDTAHVTVTSSTFTGNSARWGGAIYSLGDSSNYNVLQVTDCTLAGGTSSDRGGGLSLSYTDATMLGCLIEDNTADDSSGQGGGLYFRVGTMEVSNCLFSGNVCSGSYGQAVMISSASGTDMTLTDVAACDHPLVYEVRGDYTDGGGNDLGNWCCPGDVNEDGGVNGDDIIAFVDDWALEGDGDDRADCNRDENVDVVDLVGLLSNWGDCEG